MLVDSVVNQYEFKTYYKLMLVSHYAKTTIKFNIHVAELTSLLNQKTQTSNVRCEKNFHSGFNFE